MKSESAPASRTSRRTEYVPVAENAWLAVNVVDQEVSHTPFSSQSQRVSSAPFEEVEEEASNVTAEAGWGVAGL